VSLPSFTVRPHQAEVLGYQGGYMGVAAVPGSGKTYTLSALAARLVAELQNDEQEVLVVTFANSSVDNFMSRIGQFVRAQGLVPGIGYRVRTLHGLAHDIIRERPDLVHLSEDFTIVDDRDATRIREQVVRAWLTQNPDAYAPYVAGDLEPSQLDKTLRRDWPDLVQEIAATFITRAKDRRYSPETLRKHLARSSHDLSLARLGTEVYAGYQRGLASRGAVDFGDLVRLALDALAADPDYLRRLQERWPFILEDEAQDSSQLQEDLLRTLAGPDGNWVRVGDPNQAIYETFTNADPRFLRGFLQAPGVIAKGLPTSGRSTPSIIAVANRLVTWTTEEHPVPSARGAFWPQQIRCAEPDDPQPNPPDDPSAVHFHPRGLHADEHCEEEATSVAKSLERWLAAHPDRTVAILVPRNERGITMVAELARRRLPCVELLRSTAATRDAANVLGAVLQTLAEPHAPRKLAAAYKAWRRADSLEGEPRTKAQRVAKLIESCPQLEDYLWPRAERDWLATLGWEQYQEPDVSEIRQELLTFRSQVQQWHRAAILPIDQLILTLAQDLFHEASELALAHKLAVVLGESAAQPDHADWRLPQLAEELRKIASNERKFIGLSGEDTGFDPDAYKGKVVVTTFHKAKGLEWDRVYLTSVNNYDFPSGLPQDSYIAERWFVRDHLNLPEEALAQLDDLMVADCPYEEGRATLQARERYIAERLRLLYVGITRARRELMVTWNTGRRQDTVEALPLTHLRTFWEQRSQTPSD